MDKTLEYALALEEGGADVIELGIPFSDPLADGPTIQAAGVRALQAGTTPQRVFALCSRLRKRSNIPIVLMTYYNPIFAMGEETFIKASQDAGADGVIVPDLPIEEATGLIEAARRHGIDTIFFATPETDGVRVGQVAAITTGFLYVMARYGITGAKEELADLTTMLIRRIQPLVAPLHLPIAVGFGLSNRQQIKTVIEAGADGAIVGSAIVERIANGISLEVLAGFVRELKQGTRQRSNE